MPIRALIGYDGSPAASAAINLGAHLFPQAHAWIAHLWTPPFASTGLRHRLWRGTGQVNQFVEQVEREGERQAQRTAAMGVTLATAAGWDAEPLLARGYAGEGLGIAELAEKMDADLVLVGSRGLGGALAVLGSVSDMVVHYTPRPVLVVPHPLLTDEYEALDDGPVLIGYNGSAGVQTAAATAARLFPTRSLQLATVADGEIDGEIPENLTATPHPAGIAMTRLHLRSGHGPHGRAVAAALAGHARQRAAAVLVVGSRGRTGLREILLGSVAMATLHTAYRPVLVAPPANQTANQTAGPDVDPSRPAEPGAEDGPPWTATGHR